MAAAATVDPYVQLGVPRNASVEQIRRAYKKACLAHHPDKHPAGEARTAAEVRFKAIVRAYTLLTENKSQQVGAGTRAKGEERENNPFEDGEYCKAFAARFAEQCKKEGYDFKSENIFDSLFGEKRASFEKRAMGEDKVEDFVQEMGLTLEEFAGGCVKKQRVRGCELMVEVKPGYRPGDRVRFKGIGGGDVVFVLTQKIHERYVMKGDDLHCTMRVKLVDALAGVSIALGGVLGEVRVQVDVVVYPGYVHCILGEGMPKREGGGRGDLYVNFEILFPKKVDAEDKLAIRDVLERVEKRGKGMGMRRSSSLFVGKGWGGIAPRRNSMANPVDDEEEEPGSFGRRSRGRKLRMPSVFR